MDKDDEKYYMDTISPSGYTSFCHCRQAWYFSYIKELSLRKRHLPLPIKLGAIWDSFQTSIYNSTHFTPKDLMDACDAYDLDDYSAAKLFALVRGWHKMGFEIDVTGAKTQAEFHMGGFDYPNDNFCFHGFVDVLYPTYFIENKLSGSPDRFRSPFNTYDQLGIYFLAHPACDHAIIRAVRAPQLKPKKLEDTEAFRDRIFADILSRPSFYFMGYDRKAATFGIKFWRSEYDFNMLARDFGNVHADMTACRADNTLCYQDKLSCNVPTQCMYLPICQTGGVNGDLYMVKGEASCEGEDNNNNNNQKEEGEV